MEMLNHCLNNFCIFDNEYYKQNIGVPMESPISGFIAEAVSKVLKSKSWHNIDHDCGSDMLMTRSTS